MASSRSPCPPTRVRRKRFRIDFINTTVRVPPVCFSGNTYVVSLSARTTLTGPEDHHTVGCSSCPAPHMSAHTVPCTSTHTRSERDSVARACCRGAWCGIGHQPHPPCACRGVACTVPAILLAGPPNVPPHGRHQTCRRAIAYCIELRSIWCGRSLVSLQLDRQGPQVDQRSAKVHTWLLYQSRRHAQPKCSYAALICAMHPFLGEPSVPPSILPLRLVDSNCFGRHLAYMSPVLVRTRSFWISSICYAVPNGIVRTRWHCSLIATSTNGCSKFCILEQSFTGIFRIGCVVSR